MNGRARRDRLVQGVTTRALVIGFVLIPPNTYLLVRNNLLFQGPVGWNVLTDNTVVALLALALLNAVLKRRRPAWAFSTGEMLTVYVMLGMNTLLLGGVYYVGGSLQATMTYPFWFVDVEEGWKEQLWPYLPTWLTVRDRDVLEGFWGGESSAYTGGVIRAWVGPALWWASFMGTVMWVCLCLNSIVRRRWADQEKLPFPLTMVPLQIADERFGLFRSKAWWIGLGAALGIFAWNMLASAVPSFPSIPLGFNFYPYVLNRFPWEALGHRFRGIYLDPLLFGLCYLIPLDMLFSLLVFELLWLAQYVLAYYLGWVTTAQGFPFVDQQAMGGLIGLALGFLWLDRRYLAQVIRKAAGLRSALPEAGQEALSYRTAVLGALVGLAYLWWFWARAGVTGWILLVFLVLYFAVAMVISRVRAQVGSPSHELLGLMPNAMLRTSLGTAALGPRTLGMFDLLAMYLVGDQENNPAPFQLETLKMAEGGRMERRRIGAALALVVPLTVLLSFWAYIHVGYQIGLGTAKTHVDHLNLARWTTDGFAASLREPTPMDPSGTAAMGFGLGVTLVLLFLKLHFAWWPLHPIAYPISNSYHVHCYTFVLFVIWLAKVLMMRYGGLRLHRGALPFFLGLTVGSLAANFAGLILANLFRGGG